MESFLKNANVQKMGEGMTKNKQKSSSSQDCYKSGSFANDDYGRDLYKNDYYQVSSDYKRLGQKKPVGPI